MSAPEAAGFDPHRATVDEATAAADPLAIARWGAAQMLTARREHFEADPLAGVHVCAKHALTMPDWLAEAYCRAYESAKAGRVTTWDAAFGSPWPKGAQVRCERERAALRLAIFRDVTDALLSDPTTPLDNILLETIGDARGVGKTKAWALYGEACAQFGYGGAKTAAAIRKAGKSHPATLRKLAGINRRR